MFKLIALLLLISPFTLADDELGLSNESSLGYVITGGNAESETTNLKHKSVYTWESDILTFTGHYLQASGQAAAATVTSPNATRSVQTAENWSTKLQFERVITPKQFTAYVSYRVLGDLFQNIREAHESEIGGKYFWLNSKATKFFTTLGYKYRRELLTSAAAQGVGVGPRIHPEFHYANLGAQIDYSYSKGFALGMIVNYSPSVINFADDQRIDFNPYLTSVLTDMFSLKVSYEGNYRSLPAVAGNAYLDFTFTTALLAKF